MSTTRVLAIAVAATVLAACSGESPQEGDGANESALSPPDASRGTPTPTPPTDLRSRLAGTWQYEDGSHLAVTCGDAVVYADDLHRTGAQKLPGTFVFRPLADGRLHELDGLGCEYLFTVDAGAATGIDGQTCDRFPDGRGGVTHLASTGVTKSIDASGLMTVKATAKIGANGECDLLVTGTATRLYH